MNTENLIAIDVFCAQQEVETSFVLALHERGLVTITQMQMRYFVELEQLPRLEQLARMHYDLDINLEGIEALSHMLERVEGLQRELRELGERLGRYEPGSDT
ncbi:MAG: chaperone modulator CbpM [Flavobacteriales bacterium]|nr:chaperone modulator CbpM [Flavobacteriales bacterium]MBK7481423.1 chaperone modulator CbpM [Flavobacteriales bacterium]MBK7620182.1 chaperone modulator CbpM [Flavobacteriales bacterium]MBP8877608.1 chaperone modulator CbpM [Flavobacteriales bacterium]MBP9178350.1 chaperone modulator CbpM [Flavobacteriales bacterium]